MKQLIILLIKSYQKVVSPLLGSRCRYYPSCSSYAIEALEKHGFFKGFWLAIKRISRCHPLAEGGLDPVPEHPHNHQCNHNHTIKDN